VGLNLIALSIIGTGLTILFGGLFFMFRQFIREAKIDRHSYLMTAKDSQRKNMEIDNEREDLEQRPKELQQKREQQYKLAVTHGSEIRREAHKLRRGLQAIRVNHLSPARAEGLITDHYELSEKGKSANPAPNLTSENIQSVVDEYANQPQGNREPSDSLRHFVASGLVTERYELTEHAKEQPFDVLYHLRHAIDEFNELSAHSSEVLEKAFYESPSEIAAAGLKRGFDDAKFISPAPRPDLGGALGSPVGIQQAVQSSATSGEVPTSRSPSLPVGNANGTANSSNTTSR